MWADIAQNTPHGSVGRGTASRNTTGQPRCKLAHHKLAQFWHAESGALVHFGFVLFLLMVMMGGIAVDLMRFESTRTSLQNTLDRCTLNASALSQQLDAKAVVTDCVFKAGLADNITSIKVTNGINFKQVEVDAKAATRPYFMQMVGIEKMDAPGHSVAEQRITNVEISLVLDVSGSMTGTKLANLKLAASEFVDTVLSSDGDDRISISLVPFNGQVNLGPVLRAKYNATDNPNVTDLNCIDLPASVYSSSEMLTTLPMAMTAHADTYSGTAGSLTFDSLASGAPNPANRWCPPLPGNIVRLPSNHIGNLQLYINALTAIGATSINAGLKWGVTLLDPSAQFMFAQLASANQIPTAFDDRPYEYDDPETMKIVVLMTDGENFAEDRVRDTYKNTAAASSPIYLSLSDGNLSIMHSTLAGPNNYWVPHIDPTGSWQAAPWNSGGTGATLRQLSWAEVWGGYGSFTGLRQSYVAWQFYARALGTDTSSRSAAYSTWRGNFRQQTPTVTMNAQLQQMCDGAKANGIIVYGIAFEAPLNGQAQISQCSTSSAHYFNAAGLQIRTAFRAIASNISQLRLTQ